MLAAYRTHLKAILMADAVGYSRQMAADEPGAVSRLDASRRLFREAIEAHTGRVVDMAGDSVLAIFATAAGAVQAACDIQTALQGGTRESDGVTTLPFRIGLHVGDVIEKDDGTAYGDGINVAARLQGIAAAGSIVVSDALASAIRDRLPVTLDDLGPQQLKNLGRAIHAFRLGWRVETADVGNTTDSGSEREPSFKSIAELNRPSIAVLPFANVSGEQGHEHLVDGITEDVIASLARNRWLFVIAAPTMFAYRGSNADARAIAKELSVRYTISGSVRRMSDRIRLTAHLIDAELGTEVWAERFDEPMSQLFELQDSLSERICTHVEVSIPLAEIERARRKHPNSLDTWDHYLLAVHSLRGLTQEGYEKAERHLADCIRVEPTFALAHARMAIAHVRAAHYGWGGATGAVAITRAQECAAAALSLDPDSALALDALASVALYRGELDSAVAFAQRAIEIDPSMTAAFGTMVNALAFEGRSDDALDAFDRCCRISPRDPDRSGLLMGRLNALFVARRFSECVTAARVLAAIRPNWYGVHVALAVALAHLGQHKPAAEAAAQLMRLVPRFNLERARRRPYFTRHEDVDALIEGLRLAGIPAS